MRSMKGVLIVGVSAFALLLGASSSAWADSNGSNGAFARINPGIDIEEPNGTVSGNTSADPGQTRPNLTTGSFNSASGIAQVQQNEGNGNSLNIATAVQVGVNIVGPVTASALVKSLVEDNTTSQTGGIRTNDVTNSFDNFSGVASVQQNNGDHNEMGIANAVQAAIGGATSSSAAATALSVVDDNGAFQSGGTRDNDITDSFDNADGVATVQQNNGSQNTINAANAVQATITGSGPASAMAVVFSEVGDEVGNRTNQNRGRRDNDVTDSFRGFDGVATVQQNNGDQNAISAANAVQVSIGGSGPSTSDANVELDTENNRANQRDGTRDNDVLRSFNDASGVATVQQNNGDHNTIGAATALHANLGGSGELTQTASTVGSTTFQRGDLDNTVQDRSSGIGRGSIRSNSIDPSFVAAQGIFTVQQNNGNANAIGASTAVAVNIGGSDPNNDDVDVSQVVDVVGTVRRNARVIDQHSTRDNDITSGSFNRSRGIVTVQQNNGDVNVMGVATAVNANIGLSESRVQNDVSQDVNVSGNKLGGGGSLDDDLALSFTRFVGQRSNNIKDSFNVGAAGMASVQQNNGSQNIMGIGNALQVNIDNRASSLDGNDDVISQTASSAGGSVQNSAAEFGTPIITDTAFPAHRENLITNSFQGYAGFASVQQNNGDNNVMGIANAIAMTLRSNDKIDDVDLSLAETDGTTRGNNATEGNTSFFHSGANRVNLINPSFNDFDGMVTVQQNNGSNNVINAANTVVANVENAGSPVDGAAGAVTNTATGVASVTGNNSSDHEFTDRVNRITSSFDSAAGIMTVQQNNGENNVMGASNAVAVEINNTTAGFGPATSMATLSATVSGNMTTVSVPEQPPGLENTISGSFISAAGIMVVQQNNGSNNAIQSAIVVTASLNPFNGGSGFLGNLR